MEKVFIGLGGNIGNVSETFDLVLKHLNEKIGPVVKSSSRYKTEPWGNKNQDNFLNQVIVAETSLNPNEVLKQIYDIEKKLGRDRDKNNQFAPRTIDIDILFFGNKIINEENLIIPHPRLHLRNFVLTPMLEIAPDFIHPTFNKSIRDLANNETDQSLVKKE
ncbi:MAG: 2-amino-4-hydroxy-6-hydroxymethyldihydropteridine diphosphokinase [Ginsengibacter sp.]